MWRVVKVSTDTINVPREHMHITSVKAIRVDGLMESAGSALIVAEQAPEIVDMAIGEIYERMTKGEGFWVRYDDDTRDRWLHVHGCPVCDTYPYLCDDTTMLPDEEEGA